MVKTSASVASLQISMPCAKQNAFVHAEHDVDADRSSRWLTGSEVVSIDRSSGFLFSGPSRIIVLFLKHVHLQYVGAPVIAKGLAKDSIEQVGKKGTANLLRRGLSGRTEAAPESVFSPSCGRGCDDYFLRIIIVGRVARSREWELPGDDVAGRLPAQTRVGPRSALWLAGSEKSLFPFGLQKRTTTTTNSPNDHDNAVDKFITHRPIALFCARRRQKMNPSIARVRRLSTRHFAHALTQQTTTRQSFALSRGIATTCAARGNNTDWLRKKIWQGDAPGAADPYTQRPDDVNSAAASETNLPDEALEMHHEQPVPEAILDSRISLPPRRSETMAERNVAAADPSYVPATTMDGLQHIAPISQWWEQPGNWGEESAFQAFASAEKVTNAAAVEVYLRRALVEALALQQTGALEQWATLKWREGGRADLDAALAVEISIQDGVASIKGDAAAVAESVTSGAETVEGGKVAADEAQAIVAGWDASWKEAVLDDQIKFAVSFYLSLCLVFIMLMVWVANTFSIAPQAPVPAHGQAARRRQARRRQHGAGSPDAGRPPAQGQEPRRRARGCRQARWPGQRGAAQPPHHAHRQGGRCWPMEGH